MAELRRVGGSMEPHRSPAGRRALLPAEVQLCNAVGLSEDEYWFFVDAAEQYNGKRDPAYDLIPDIRNDAVITPILINLAIGLVLTGIAVLLAPKPKALDQDDKRLAPQTLGGADGATNFAQTEGFQSVQDLARPGQTIPLVFAKKGVRVNGQLVWSQMEAQQGSLLLKAQFVFSDGVTEEPPDFAGLAIGDTTLSTYTAKKVRAYWRSFGGRIQEDQALEGSGLPPQNFTDTFSTYWDGLNGVAPFFCGATFTSVQSQFGCYAPMPNNTPYTPTPELILIPDDADDDLKEDLEARIRLMNESKFSQRAFFSRAIRNGVNEIGYYGQLEPSDVPGGTRDKILYRLTTSCEDFDDPDYAPEKLGFVNSATVSTREAADQNILIGEVYLVGNVALAVCAQKIYTPRAAGPWAPDNTEIKYRVEQGNDLSAWFDIITAGEVQCIKNINNNIIESELDAVDNPILNHDIYALQRASIATVTNTTPCQATELIIKSNVWKQVSGFPDLQAWPSAELIAEYEEYGGSLSLGPITKYQRRLSFFRLEVRTVGEENWVDITGPGYFMVEGSKPVDQYTYIRVDVGAKGNVESEFRLLPVAGIGALRNGYGNSGVEMKRLRLSGAEGKYFANGYTVTYCGETVSLTDDFLTTPEFIKSEDSTTKDGGLTNINIEPKEAGTFPSTESEWRFLESRLNPGSPANHLQIKQSAPPNTVWTRRWQYWWDNSLRAQGNFPPQDYREPPKNQIQQFPFNADFRYSWEIPPPQQEWGLEPGFLTVYRQVKLEQNVKLPPKAYVAGLVDAKPELDPVTGEPRIANPNAKGLKFWVEVYQDNLGNDVGYKWYVDSNNQGENYTKGDRLIVTAPEGSRDPGYEIFGVTVTGTVPVEDINRPEENYSIFDPILDLPTFDSQSQSNTSAPEHELVAINEKRAQPAATFDEMTTGGIRISSSTEWSNFNSFSAFMKKGIVIPNLATETFEASNLLPDIVYSMMTNDVWGAGSTLGEQQVDRESMAKASMFCAAMDFTWDGVVGDRIGFREWVFQNAQFCLLDATVIGGRFALIPAVPVTASNEIGYQSKPDIKALFTDGNMRDMQVTWLSPEERQLFKAEVLWREDTVNGFSKTRQFTMRWSDAQGGSDKDPIESFDMSQFCTSQNHAQRFAQYALGLRKYVDHAISFKTTPQAAMGLQPGEYFKVSSEASHTSRFNNGSINSEGYVTSNETLADGSYPIYYWRPGTEGISEATISVSGGRCADAAFYGTVFTLKMTTVESRVYKLESLTYAEEGLVEVAGSYMPLTNIGSLSILDWNPAYYVSTGL